jgi:hypothetical protein
VGLNKHGYTPKKRNSNSRKRKKIIFIATEGKNKTEKLYFKKFNSDKVQIRFAKGGSTDPVNMVSELLSECKDMGFDPKAGDKGYCVLDSDFVASKNKQIASADKIAKDNALSLIVSSPCFEIWYLCHYDYSTKAFGSNEEVIDVLKKKIPQYDKNKEDMYELLRPILDNAVSNAKRLEKYNLQGGKMTHTVEFMPSTEVYRIIETIIEAENA